jgi:hypothetical protein
MAIAQVGIPGSFCDTSVSINRVWQMRLTGEVRPADCAAGLVKSLMAAVGGKCRTSDGRVGGADQRRADRFKAGC